MSAGEVTIFLGGDVMLGRGVDQILACPGDPTLREGFIVNADDYVRLAEQANGPIVRPVDPAWPWGRALRVLDEAAPDVRVINLETSVTRSDDFASGRSVHYRMSPDNVACLTQVRPDACVLANNHVLDFGSRGLEETLDVLSALGLHTTGAGRDVEEAERPATLPLPGGGRVLVFAWGMASSGVPAEWAATADRPGVALLTDSPLDAAAEVVERVHRHRGPGDIVVVSVHWGSNWGHEVSRRQTDLAHALIDEGVDVVHGHSSHHPRPIEVYRDRLILYGCGDLINDYEGISGREAYRSDLRLLYLASVAGDTGRLIGMRMVPLRARQMRLDDASHADTDWLRGVLDRISQPFGVRIDHGDGGGLRLQPSR